MGLKFLNKKGWHTGSIRNIENVWKAEQKHEAEQRKLEELRKQIHEERERDEFRLLQEKAGLTPRQERLEFLYDSGLAVGKSSSDGFKALEAYPRADIEKSASASASVSASTPDSSKSSVPGALFEEKPQSANDAWRKLHSDPLLMIRQREHEALAKIKNNPVKMAMIRKSVEAKKKNDDESFDEEHWKVKSKHGKHSSSKYCFDSENNGHEEKERRKKAKKKNKDHLDSDEDSPDRSRRRRHSLRDRDGEKQWHSSPSKHKSDRSQEDVRDRARHNNRHSHSHRDYESEEDVERSKRSYEKAKHEDYPRDHQNEKSEHKVGNDDSSRQVRDRARHDNRHSHSLGDYESEEDVALSKRSYEKAKREDYPRDLQNEKSEHKAGNDDSSRQVRDRARHDNRHSHSHRDYESEDVERSKGSCEKSRHEDNRRDHQNDKYEYKARNDGSTRQVSDSNHSGLPPRPDSYKRRGKAPQLSEEERAARLREMQVDAELHEERRWKRLKKADEDDVREASNANNTNRGSSFLDAVQKSVYGAEKGGSSTIEESVRRRTHFLQGSREANERNAFRR